MAVSEAQLATWSNQGSVTQSAQTYESIRTVLKDPEAPYSGRDFTVFLQGSYGNDTNVYRDSDVDIVIRLNQTYYAETDLLQPIAKARYDAAREPATYNYDDFKTEVLTWLRRRFGAAVVPGNKAIAIRGDSNRRDADVLVCANSRWYMASSSGVDRDYAEGITFWTAGGIKIINYPEQHADNCTSKHQATRQRFKRLVRVYKNMRNRMIDDDYLSDGVAPSYFIEGMLWNAPTELFTPSYADSFINTFNWFVNTEKTNLLCANGIHWLVRDNYPTSWHSRSVDAYLAATTRFWNEQTE